MKVISFTNQKGGVGKTTSCFNIGKALSLCGYKVLFIDSDPQGDLSTMGGFKSVKKGDMTLYDVLHGVDINRAVKECDGYSMIISDDTLTKAEIDLVKVKRTVLKESLESLESDFDYVFIDCPPSLNVLTVDALTASDEIIIPVQAQYLPLKGVARLKETVEKVRLELNPRLKIGGVIMTFFDSRRNLDHEVRESLEKVFKAKVFETAISTNTKIAEAPSFGKSVLDYAPRSKGALQYKAIAQELISGHETTEKGKGKKNRKEVK